VDRITLLPLSGTPTVGIFLECPATVTGQKCKNNGEQQCPIKEEGALYWKGVGEYINETLAFLVFTSLSLRSGNQPGGGVPDSPARIRYSNIGAHRGLANKNPRCQEKEPPQ
jgi:hypothetical protein